MGKEVNIEKRFGCKGLRTQEKILDPQIYYYSLVVWKGKINVFFDFSDLKATLHPNLDVSHL